MRVITWNIHGALKDSLVWELLLELRPDVILLQEVGRDIPDKITEVFEVKSRRAASKKGNLQRFSTAVLVKGKIIKEIPLSSQYGWVNRELEFFNGNFVSCVVQPTGHEQINAISVYSPAWAVNKGKLVGIDTAPVKLKTNPNVWGTEIIWSALKNIVSDDEKWVVGGDYNISETFDIEYQEKNSVRFGIRSHGNKEILDRMRELGFTECLSGYNHKIIPTFKSNKNKKVEHQMDHLFVTNNIYSQIKGCDVGKVWLSDHLPIIADFSDK